MKTLFYEHLNTYKIYYLFNLGVFVGGILFGFFYVNYQTEAEISTLSMNITEMLNGQYIQNKSYVSHHLTETLFILSIIYILSMSIVAIPILPIILFYKSMQIGFTAALYIKIFSYKGIFGIIMTIMPYIIFEIIAYFSSFAIAYEVSLSLAITSFIKKQTLDLKEVVKHLFNNFIWSLCFILLSVLTQIYVLPQLFRLFVR